jgi:ubiquinone/menaquinone biosynthesis C-methylase UbiE
MIKNKQRVCPVEHAGSLDSKFRRLFQNPEKILRPYIQKGMTILEIGCGPGFFTLDMAKMIGESGKVIAVDLQEGMLEKVKAKITGTELENRIELHQCEENKIGLSTRADFIMLFYMVHEVPDKPGFFSELFSLLKAKGQVLIVEPPFHVSKSQFKQTLQQAQDAGLINAKGPRMLFSKTAILSRATR